jgi:hypothetical protein
MTSIPNIPSGGKAAGADDFSKRIQAEKARLAGQAPPKVGQQVQ